MTIFVYLANCFRSNSSYHCDKLLSIYYVQICYSKWHILAVKLFKHDIEVFGRTKFYLNCRETIFCIVETYYSYLWFLNVNVSGKFDNAKSYRAFTDTFCHAHYVRSVNHPAVIYKNTFKITKLKLNCMFYTNKMLNSFKIIFSISSEVWYTRINYCQLYVIPPI